MQLVQYMSEILASRLVTEVGINWFRSISTWRAAFPPTDQMSLNRRLQVAINSQDVPAAREAVSAGASVNSCNRDGLPALHAALSCTVCALEMVKLLLEAGSKVNRGREQDGRTALHVACDEGLGLEVVEALLSAGADPNAGDMDGWTPLHCACYMGSAVYVGILIRQGAEVKPSACLSSSSTVPYVVHFD